jgi:hypothetical protein
VTNRGRLLTASDLIRMMEDQRKPFDQWEEDGLIIRDFHRGADWWLFKWHADECDRIIWATNRNDWMFQFENEEPIRLKRHREIEIPMGVVHRIIPGKSQLQIAILEIQ